MSERALARAIHSVVEDAVPSSPWLEHRVMAAVREDAAGSRPRQPQFTLRRMALATVAAALIPVLAIGVLYESRLPQSNHPAPATSPGADPSVVRYQHMVDAHLNAIDGAYVAAISCHVRQLCRDGVIKMRAATQSLLDDLEANPAPSRVESQGAALQAATRNLLVHLDTAIAAMDDPSSDFTAIYYGLNTDGLDLAVAMIECWPAGPYVRPDLINSYGCAPAPTSNNIDHQ